MRFVHRVGWVEVVLEEPGVPTDAIAWHVSDAPLRRAPEHRHLPGMVLMKEAGSTDRDLRRLVSFVVGRGLKTFLAEHLKQLQFIHPTAQLTEQVVGIEVGTAPRRMRVQQGG